MSIVPELVRDNRNYRRLFLSTFASCVGTGISTIAYPLLVLSLLGSAELAGSVGAASLVARLACRLPAAQLADRLNPRGVMVGADLVRVAAVGSIPAAAALGVLSFPQLLATAVIEGMAAALFAVDRVLPFSCDAASYAVSALLLAGIRARSAPARAVPSEAVPAGHGLTAGLRWLLGERWLLAIAVYAGALNLACAALNLMVVVVLRAHGVSTVQVGLTVSCAGAGAVVGALLAPRLAKALSVRSILLGVGCGWTAILTTFTLVYSPWLIAGLLTVLLTLSPASSVAIGTELFGRPPRELVGRVSAVVGLLLTGLTALGPLAAGALFQALGMTGGWLILAAFCGAVTALGWRSLRPPTTEPTPAEQPVEEPAELEVLAHGQEPLA